jgi:hypothetical protein
MRRSIDFHGSLLLLFIFFSCVFQNGIALGAKRGVARISQLAGAVTITRGTNAVPVAQGARLMNQDSVSTGADGSVGIIFDDETTLSLGPGSKMIIQEYIFDVEKANFSLVVRLMQGTAAYVSGLIAKLSPDSTKFITPSASIGIRGTKFVIQVDPI